MNKSAPEIIIALDTSSREKALKLAQEIRPATTWVKIGLELFTACGPDIVRDLKIMDYKVFLDLKLMDIPNTVNRALLNCLDLGADMLTLHLLGGKKMIESARESRDKNKGSQEHKPLLVGVTLLTSLNQEDLPWDEPKDLSQIVLDLAAKARNWGTDGVVCSGLEASGIRKLVDPDFCLVTPGIRTNTEQQDQKRTVTPKQAWDAGATHLVLGRAVTQAENPCQAVMDIKNELSSPPRGANV